MTISIVDLRTLLTSNLGSQYELKGSDFGAASSELFTKYIPGGSLAITAPAPDADALTLGGSARISSLTQPVGLLVKFLPDAQNATVAGMTLTFDLPGWSFEADFASFQGSALGVMGFADPKLILAASAPGASGTTCSPPSAVPGRLTLKKESSLPSCSPRSPTWTW